MLNIADGPELHGLKSPDYKFALRVALHAAAITKDDHFYAVYVHNALGLAYFKAGDRRKAIQATEKAIALAEKNAAKSHPRMLDEMRKQLERFKQPR